MQISYPTSREQRLATEKMLADFPILLSYRLDSVAPFPYVQSHSGIEIYYVNEGEGCYLVGNKICALQAGVLIVIRPYTMHKVLLTDSGNIISRHVLTCDPQFIQPSRGESEALPLMTSDLEFLYVQTGGRLRERIEQLYANIHMELSEQGAHFKTIVRSMAHELVLLAHRLHTKPDAALFQQEVRSIPEEIVYLVQYIGSNFQEKVTLDSLARTVHLNKTYMLTLFKKYTGHTIGDFLLLKRIHHAKKLLRETQLKVAEIGYRSGFNDGSHFTRMFRNHEKTTPLAYRKAQKQQLLSL
jgi:AraC-like DNA-binding protein